VRQVAALRAHTQARVQARAAEIQAQEAQRAQGSSGPSGAALQPSAPQPPSDGPQQGQLDLQPGYHFLVSGVPGVGKTTLAVNLVARLQQLWGAPAVFIDSKGGEFDNLPGAAWWRKQEAPHWPWDGEIPQAVQEGQQPLLLVWTPEYDDIPTYGAFLESLHNSSRPNARRPVIIVVDELSSLGGTNPQSFPVSLAKILKQGRARHITLVVLTQELAYIPRQVLRMTTHLLMMMQDSADPNDFDTRRVVQLSGLPAPTEKYQFNYRNRMVPGQRWQYQNYQQFLGLARQGAKSRRPGRPAFRKRAS